MEDAPDAEVWRRILSELPSVKGRLPVGVAVPLEEEAVISEKAVVTVPPSAGGRRRTRQSSSVVGEATKKVGKAPAKKDVGVIVVSGEDEEMLEVMEESVPARGRSRRKRDETGVSSLKPPVVPGKHPSSLVFLCRVHLMVDEYGIFVVCRFGD